MSSPASAAPAAERPIVIQQRGGALLRVLCWLGWIGFFCAALVVLGQWMALGEYFDVTGGLSERYYSGARFARSKIAIVSVEGVMLKEDGFAKRQIDRVRQDKDVRAVVVRINSPGGAVSVADYLYHHLVKLREERELPMVVSMGGIAASGGYYVAMAVGDQEDVIFAEPTTTTGSIGVIVPHFDLSGLLAKLDVKDDSFVTDPRKEMLSMTKPVPPEHRALIEAYLREAFDRFKEVVRQGRPALRRDPKLLEAAATGEIFAARQALERKLVDRIGFLEDAVARAAELAGLSADEARVVYYKRPPTLLSLVGLGRSGPVPLDAASLLDWTAPRAYYLAATVPALAGWPARPAP